MNTLSAKRWLCKILDIVSATVEQLALVVDVEQFWERLLLSYLVEDED
jgi:hypothetical protein